MSNPAGPQAFPSATPNGAGNPAVTPHGTAAAPHRMRFAAFGDSLMWGQGVARDDLFSVLTAKGIGALHQRDGRVAFDHSRSGAQIRVRDGSDREDFVDTYPYLFDTPTQEQEFLEGDESHATKLSGEVPCSFPTVTWQVHRLEDHLADDIEVALACGGANDIDFETILNARDNPRTFVDKVSGDIR